MRLWPRSIAGRLLAIAAVSTTLALVFAGLTIGHVLERFVMRGLDDRLDVQVAVLARAVRPDATLDPARVVALPGFGEAGSGWTWRVVSPGGRVWASGADLPAIDPHPPERHRGRLGSERHPRAGEAHAADGEPLHLRSVSVTTPAGPVAIVASGPRRVIDAPLREALLPLLACLALLGGGLAVATLVQLRLGLRPLRAMQQALGEVVAGTRAHVPEDQPAELVPLATELNGLIDRNAAGLAHARRHVANLAHGLKTPLAAIGLKLGEGARDPDGSLGRMLDEVDRRIRHHLRRARAVAGGAAGRARAPVARCVDDLVTVLQRIHAARALAVTVSIAGDPVVAVDPQDLDEMIGNLLDNAWRHAAQAICVSTIIDAGTATIVIEDDGPGLAEAVLVDALRAGRRLDERGEGYGFGLSITEELAELNGGALSLGRSAAMGGLCATLTLPVAALTA